MPSSTKYLELQKKWPFFNKTIIIFQGKFSILSAFILQVAVHRDEEDTQARADRDHEDIECDIRIVAREGPRLALKTRRKVSEISAELKCGGACLTSMPHRNAAKNRPPVQKPTRRVLSSTMVYMYQRCRWKRSCGGISYALTYLSSMMIFAR